MFLADLISNCFFEVNDVNILCFQGFQSFTDVKVHPKFDMNHTLDVGVILALCIVLLFCILGKFGGKN